jgi:hypothetical protein
MKLSSASVAGLKLPEGKSELLVFDDTLPGFGVRLRAGGKRSWIAQYRKAQVSGSSVFGFPNSRISSAWSGVATYP